MERLISSYTSRAKPNPTTTASGKALAHGATGVTSGMKEMAAMMRK